MELNDLGIKKIIIKIEKKKKIIQFLINTKNKLISMTFNTKISKKIKLNYHQIKNFHRLNLYQQVVLKDMTMKGKKKVPMKIKIQKRKRTKEQN